MWTCRRLTTHGIAYPYSYVVHVVYYHIVVYCLNSQKVSVVEMRSTCCNVLLCYLFKYFCARCLLTFVFFSVTKCCQQNCYFNIAVYARCLVSYKSRFNLPFFCDNFMYQVSGITNSPFLCKVVFVFGGMQFSVSVFRFFTSDS